MTKKPLSAKQKKQQEADLLDARAKAGFAVLTSEGIKRLENEATLESMTRNFMKRFPRANDK